MKKRCVLYVGIYVGFWKTESWKIEIGQKVEFYKIEFLKINLKIKLKKLNSEKCTWSWIRKNWIFQNPIFKNLTSKNLSQNGISKNWITRMNWARFPSWWFEWLSINFLWEAAWNSFITIFFMILSLNFNFSPFIIFKNEKKIYNLGIHMDTQVFRAKLESRLPYRMIQPIRTSLEQFFEISQHKVLQNETDLIPATQKWNLVNIHTDNHRHRKCWI